MSPRDLSGALSVDDAGITPQALDTAPLMGSLFNEDAAEQAPLGGLGRSVGQSLAGSNSPPARRPPNARAKEVDVRVAAELVEGLSLTVCDRSVGPVQGSVGFLVTTIVKKA